VCVARIYPALFIPIQFCDPASTPHTLAFASITAGRFERDDWETMRKVGKNPGSGNDQF
jgi:hypothetical protein